MKFWQSLAFTEPEELTALAKGAEAAGFEGVLLSEHLFVPEDYAARYPYALGGRPDFEATTPFPDPWVTIAALAAETETLQFATMVHILPLHHPLEVAKAAGTAAVFSADRVILGVGAGWMKEEFDALGVDYATRGSRFDESIEVLRKVWTGEMVEHHGRHFDFPRLQMRPAPRRTPPIYIGGASPPALRRAARLGDGWVGAGNTPDEAETLLGEIGRMRREAGRTNDDFEAIVPLVTPLDSESLRRIADAGATGTVHFPFQYTLGPDASLQAKLDAMDRFGDEVIGKTRSAGFDTR